MRRSTLEAYYRDKVPELRQQVSYRFRSSHQVSPVGLSNHLEISRGARVTPPLDVGYIRPGRPTGEELAKVMSQLEGNYFASFCVQSLDKMSNEDYKKIVSALEHKYS